MAVITSWWMEKNGLGINSVQIAEKVREQLMCEDGNEITPMIEDKYYKPVEKSMSARHELQWEKLGTGRSEELPSEMSERHEQEWKKLEERRKTLTLEQWCEVYPHSTCDVQRADEGKRLKPIGFIGKDILAVEVTNDDKSIRRREMTDTQLVQRYYAQQERIERLESWVIEAISKPCMTRDMREQGLDLVEELSPSIREAVERICPPRSQSAELTLEREI